MGWIPLVPPEQATGRQRETYRRIAGNTLPGWLLEPIGVYVSLLNNCAYCVDHHAVGLAREPADQGAADAIVSAQRDAAATGADVWASLATRNGSYFATRAGSPSIP